LAHATIDLWWERCCRRVGDEATGVLIPSDVGAASAGDEDAAAGSGRSGVPCATEYDRSGVTALRVSAEATAGALRITAARRASDTESGSDRRDDDSYSNTPFNFLVLLHVTTTVSFFRRAQIVLTKNIAI